MKRIVFQIFNTYNLCHSNSSINKNWISRSMVQRSRPISHDSGRRRKKTMGVAATVEMRSGPRLEKAPDRTAARSSPGFKGIRLKKSLGLLSP